MKQWLEQAVNNYWLKQYIMLGYAGKGTVYLSIGILTLQAAFFTNRQVLGTKRTLSFLTRQPLGKLFVCLLAFTLIGYVLRRFFQTILTTDKSDLWSIKSILQRGGYFISGLSYAGVAYSALNLVLEMREYDDRLEDLVQRLFERALGKWVVIFGGVIVIIVGLGYLRGAYTGSYISDFQSNEIERKLEKWATRIGQVGVGARGITFVLTGIFLIEAAIADNSELAGGLQNVLNVLASQSLGWLWLSAIGSGFICYGLYMYVATIYRRYVVR